MAHLFQKFSQDTNREAKTESKPQVQAFDNVKVWNKNLQNHLSSVFKEARLKVQGEEFHLHEKFTNACHSGADKICQAASLLNKSLNEAKLLVQREIVSVQGRGIMGERMLASLSSSLYSVQDGIPASKHLFDLALSVEQVSRSINGVPVYTIGNPANEFVLVSDIEGNKSLGLFCFLKEDAESLLAQVKDRDPSLGKGARVVEVSLDKVYRLKAEGIAFRFLPDAQQVKYALEERSKKGDSAKAFSGVPVFQSDNLILKLKNRRLCPVFFRKEDLETALNKALGQQKKTNPSLPVTTTVQVGSLEDVLKKMESSSNDSGWTDVVFIPPGIDAKSYLDKTIKEEPVGKKKKSSVVA